MNKGLQQVEEFHQTFKIPVLEEPTIIPQDRFNLRISLIEEELSELQDAYAAGDKVEILDALGDLRYVLDGAILELGCKNVFDEAFDRIHASNMSKACNDQEEAERTMLDYAVNKNVKTKGVLSDGGKYLIYRKSDNKVLKSINYEAVNLKDLV